jgi:hypothetical protein
MMPLLRSLICFSFHARKMPALRACRSNFVRQFSFRFHPHGTTMDNVAQGALSPALFTAVIVFLLPRFPAQLWLAKLLDEEQSRTHEPARFPSEDHRADVGGCVGGHLLSYGVYDCHSASAFTSNDEGSKN